MSQTCRAMTGVVHKYLPPNFTRPAFYLRDDSIARDALRTGIWVWCRQGLVIVYKFESMLFYNVDFQSVCHLRLHLQFLGNKFSTSMWRLLACSNLVDSFSMSPLYIPPEDNSITFTNANFINNDEDEVDGMESDMESDSEWALIDDQQPTSSHNNATTTTLQQLRLQLRLQQQGHQHHEAPVPWEDRLESLLSHNRDHIHHQRRYTRYATILKYKNECQLYPMFSRFRVLDLSQLRPTTNLALVQNVHTLILSKCVNITNVSCLTNVHTLDISFCFRITSLAGLENVQNLNASFCPFITDVSPVASAHALNFTGCLSLQDVSALASVHTLTLAQCPHIDDVAALSCVHTLDLSFCVSITDVASLGSIHSLNLTGCSSIAEVPSHVLAQVPHFTPPSHIAEGTFLSPSSRLRFCPQHGERFVFRVAVPDVPSFPIPHRSQTYWLH
eukprot:m.231468 g.231468  ORF g.231468 m.231468 type:complete len:445 (-) comp13899_c1_seq12:265-1599(-)